MTKQGMDLGLGPDVDAACGLVHDEQAGPHRQPAREHDLLLVPAREIAHALLERSGTNVQALRKSGCDADLFGRAEHAPARGASRHRQHDVLLHAHLQDKGLLLAVLRHEPDAGGDRGAWREC